MINRNKKGIIVLMALFVAVLMIGIPVSAAATPSTPSYLASGNTMNYVFTATGYTYSQTYHISDGKTYTNTYNRTCQSVPTSYYNLTVDSSNNTAANITIATYYEVTEYGVTVPGTPKTNTTTNKSINYAKYMVPTMIKSTSKNITINEVGTFSNYGYPHKFQRQALNVTLNYTKSTYMPYYKSEFGSVKATDYVIDNVSKYYCDSPHVVPSYTNITGNVYISPVNDMLIGYTLTTTTTSVTSGTTAANETYTITSTTDSYMLADTNAIPIHTDYTGAYVGIVVAAVLLGVVVYYFYARKPAAPKTPEKKEAESKEEESKTK
jgi:hypothetical protein